jgi:adenylate cyclase
MGIALQSLLKWISLMVVDSGDSEDLLLRKTIGVFCAAVGSVISLGSALAFFFSGIPLLGGMWLGYSIWLLAGLLVFRKGWMNYQTWAYFSISPLIPLPFLSAWLSGGPLTSGGMLVWGLFAPLLNLIVLDPRHTLYWLGAHLALPTLNAFVPPFGPPLPQATNLWLTLYNLGAISVFVVIVFQYFVNQRNLFQERSENLLLNILPAEIAAILKTEPRTIAHAFDGASILFADVVDFTPLSARMSPTETVELLNEVFSHFDTIVEKHGLEKIKTIGDCYMAAAGVPRPRPDHAQAIVRAAVEMRDYVAQKQFKGQQIEFRIGVNSGAVVAGVIGRKKFIYDLWGDAVNTASRMESHGEGGVIQITRNTYELVKNDFHCEPRGQVNVKGKGEMEVWGVIEAS